MIVAVKNGLRDSFELDNFEFPWNILKQRKIRIRPHGLWQYCHKQKLEFGHEKYREWGEIILVIV